MSLPRPPVSQEQLRLFQPRPNHPGWTTFPEEVRQEAMRLLTEILAECRSRKTQPADGEEVSDE